MGREVAVDAVHLLAGERHESHMHRQVLAAVAWTQFQVFGLQLGDEGEEPLKDEGGEVIIVEADDAQTKKCRKFHAGWIGHMLLPFKKGYYNRRQCHVSRVMAYRYGYRFDSQARLRHEGRKDREAKGNARKNINREKPFTGFLRELCLLSVLCVIVFNLHPYGSCLTVDLNPYFLN